MKRQEARELLMQMFFQMEAQNDFSKTAQDKFVNDYAKDTDQLSYIQKTAVSFAINKESVDQTIENASIKWNIDRIAKVDLAILRLAVTEIFYLKDKNIPVQVSINEAVNLAKKFGSEESGKFVNGILGKIVNEK